MRIANNIMALNAFNSLSKTEKSFQRVINSLSTGLRMNSASDDAAGFAISERLRSQIGGIDTALRNSQDGISLLQTAEGALEQVNSMLQRMRDLSIQASNDSLTSNDRQYIQLEINQLKDEIDRIAGTTQFNKKRILDGSSGALWASSDPGVRARINGGLTHIDNFGQKVSAEGNYRIEIKADPGQAQVQKSNIMSIHAVKDEKYEPEFYEININDQIDTFGATSGKGWNFANNMLNITEDGTYYIVGKLDSSGQSIQTSNGIKVSSGVKASIFLRDVNILTNGYGFDMTGAEVDLWIDPGKNGNENVITGGTGGGHCSAMQVPEGSKLTISSVKGDYSTEGVLRVTGTAHGAGIGGSCATGTTSTIPNANAGDITILGGTIIAQGGDLSAGIGGGSYGGGTGGDFGTIRIYGGDITATGGHGAAGIGTGAGGSGTAQGTIIIGGEGSVTAEAGTAYRGQGSGIGGGVGWSTANASITIDPSTNVTATGYASIGSGENSDNDTTYISTSVATPPARQIPERPTQEEPITYTLADIEQFYNSDGVFLTSQPKTLTITQGDGQTASITLYETDTMEDVARKINDVIAHTFGNAKYTDNPNKFCTISDGTKGTSESIYGREDIYNDDGDLTGYNTYATMLVRSAIPGKDGELSFSGDEDLLKALGLNTIQESTESRFTASVYDAHSGKVVTSGAKITGNVIQNALTGVDIEFSSMAGIKSSWDEASKRFILTGTEYSANIHLKDNGITFQTGANKGEDYGIQLGDVSTYSLGISGVSVSTRDSAASSTGIIDRAISRISSQRAKIGSYINDMEYIMNNLTTTSVNLTSADSRLRDADMAKTMMDFVRLQILNQSGTSMLAQANQIPQSVMNLFGN